MLGRIRAVSATALEQGALQPIETSYTILAPKNNNKEPTFLLRVLTNVARKQAETKIQREKPFNPFLPYDKNMYVQDVGTDHVLLLNKFNVVDNHALIVTKRFEEQNSLLGCSDMKAMWICLTEMRGIGFYNAGEIAGASQRHKHLQIVPTPMVPNSDTDTPFEQAVLQDVPCGTTYKSSSLDYLHAIVRMDDCAQMARDGHVEDAASVCMERYIHMLKALEQAMQEAAECETSEKEEESVEGCSDGPMQYGRQPFSYNILMSRRWMMVIPRRRECFQDVSVNSMGFIGCLLARDQSSAQRVLRAGGMSVLRAVAYAPIENAQL